MSRKRNAWTYIDARDLGQIVHLCLKKDGLGFQVFNAVNDTITATMPTKAFLAKYAPNTPVTREMGEFEGPLSNRKIREVLGFKEEHDWRKYVRNWADSRHGSWRASCRNAMTRTAALCLSVPWKGRGLVKSRS